MNTYEWQLKLRETANIPSLVNEAARVETWEWIVLGAMVAGLFLGSIVYWKWGSKLGSSE
jgi:hypothetical protein